MSEKSNFDKFINVFRKVSEMSEKIEAIFQQIAELAKKVESFSALEKLIKTVF